MTRDKNTKENYWNKKTVAALVIVLVATNLGTAGVFLYINRPSAIRSFVNLYPLVDPSRNLIAQEHFLTTLQPLRQELFALAAREAEEGNNVSIYLEYLNTGSNIAINNDIRTLPASLIKLPLALTVMKKVEDGEWRLDDELVLLPGDADPGSGELYAKPLGTRFTVEELLRAVLTDSDNTAFNIFTRNLEPEEHAATHEALGLAELFDSDGRISAKEYSRLFRALYTASFLNRADSELLLEWLAESSFDEFLHTGLPEGVVFSHKFGVNVRNRVYLDSGIVYEPNRPYLLTVLIHRSGVGLNSFDRSESARIMKEISVKAYQYINEQ